MIKTLRNSLRNERFPFSLKSSSQKSIPIRKVFDDGIWKTNRNYSQTWKFEDINYAVSSLDEKKDIVGGYGSFLNTAPPDACTKITIFNRRMDKRDFSRNVLLRERSDGLDKYRHETNSILLDKTEQGNGIIREKYITVSAPKKNIKEARPFFNRIENDFRQGFNKLSSSISPLDLESRLKILHDFFRIGEDSSFNFDLKQLMRHGQSFKDLICPSAIQFKPSYFTIGEKYGRVLFLRDYSSFIKDRMISEFTDLPLDMMLSIDILPIPTEEAIKEMQLLLLKVEANIARWQRSQNKNNIFTATIPYELEQMRNVIREYLDDITSRDQRLMFGLVTLVHLADSKEQLDADTETIQAIAQKSVCTMANMYAQQEAALNTVLPYGIRPIEAVRTLTTESASVIMPFNCQEIMDKGGVYCGQNVISRNPIICDRSKLQNPHSWILGVSGSGKSMYGKFVIEQLILSTDDDVIILDVENEYSTLIKAMGGTVIDVSASSKNHINALDLSSGYGGDDDPVTAKSEFILSLCDIIMRNGIEAQEHSIIDRVSKKIYKQYSKSYSGKAPTFLDFYEELKRQPESEAADIALAIELFTKGTLNVFAKQTNVDTSSRIISYNLNRLGKQLMNVGMLVTLDSILNRVSANRANGKRTHIFIDEMHIYFRNEYSSQFFANAWKRFRKYDAYLTGITQNITEIISDSKASTMLANSEFLVLLNQAPQDREKLASLLNIPDSQLSSITNAAAGSGLIRIGKNLVPFSNTIPTDLELYKLISTRPNEKLGA